MNSLGEVTIDLTAPSVADLAAPQPFTAAAVSATVRFDEPMADGASARLEPNAGGLSVERTAADTFVVRGELGGVVADGAYDLVLTDALDVAGNSAGDVALGRVVVDTRAPDVVEVVGDDTTPQRPGLAPRFAIVFDEPVLDVTARADVPGVGSVALATVPVGAAGAEVVVSIPETAVDGELDVVVSARDAAGNRRSDVAALTSTKPPSPSKTSPGT